MSRVQKRGGFCFLKWFLGDRSDVENLCDVRIDRMMVDSDLIASLRSQLGSSYAPFGASKGPLGVLWNSWVVQAYSEALKQLLLNAPCESLVIRMVVLQCVFDAFQ